MPKNHLIAVGLIKPKGKVFWQCNWVDPETGKQRRRSTGQRRRRDAEVIREQVECEVNSGVVDDYHEWQAFSAYYSDHATLATTTLQEWKTVSRKLIKYLDPGDIRDLTTPALTKFARAVRQTGIAETTVDKYLRTISAALGWARQQKLLLAVPTMPYAKQARRKRKMKGRPITGEEFDRMLDAVIDVVEKPQRVAEWQRVLKAIWWGGFRLSEIPDLYWDRPDKLMPWDITSRRPTMVIHGDLEKGGRDRPYYPLAPEFAQLLRETPEQQRTGPIFRPEGRLGETRDGGTIGRTIGRIGKQAGVVVGTKTTKKSDAPQNRFASAHDLRRSFGTRWAMRVKPLVLKELMRHVSIKTTEDYYVEFDSEELGDLIWSAYEQAGSVTGHVDLFVDPKAKTAANRRL